MRNNVSRRAFVGTIASAVAVGLAGCTGAPSDGTETESNETTTKQETATESEAVTTTADSDTYMNGVSSDASVSFEVPSAGAELTSTYVQWKATADGVTIEEAGAVNEGAGHYHILVDTEPVTPGEVIPSDDSHIHYGTGQEDGVLELEPGEHTLHLQVGDGKHKAMDLVETVEVTVRDEASLSLDTSVDGSVVEWDITAENYTIEPSSNGINSNAGHLHALIDTDHVPVGDVIPSDARHIHFGDGSTSGSLDLAEQLGDEYEPGEHTIHFQVGSGTHRATMVHTHTTVTTE
ncbi:DUF4399 domain-containing protein [Haloferax mediterranei ATCC 33500]|uniref:DUF4399 domain-containing protein n=1 Tax=Haloferax mediterranei (strain ATCC 33500 / DSM 1411 / JCM 8866 / NBRC 14739 / NCIMB 2177 / R-4) TaxID=523841 RepID=I3R4P2_HALMT|nr:DUF4399 domain-containing protein [Haloferax mediterranei]AFK19202.1 hypothetical protein HFX_1494 [Haloferax mediterranei ATCC 33500]AHZ21434.1 hypothetical protein BM92_01665 [Haloferax mediterranei ATCC 33500]EMA03892.1 hypothetical protein C439_03003 [Haloferax mediterranei ATCC 33500]QCQ75672.1 DUF4399 domain-containing protein [Haloferax mediterranei ATCC 33500]